jgi:transcriptional regulator with XRE-family HTH domain
MRPLAPELEAKIDEIKSWMLDGDQKEVARRARTWETRVSQILNKRIAPDKRILDAAIEVMNENKARFECSPKMRLA